MPKIGGEDVEKAQRRQNRTSKILLNFDVALNKVGIRAEPVFAHGVDVFAIESLIEPYFVEGGLRMENGDGMQRCARRKCMRRQAEENSDSENDHEQDDVDLAQVGF